ncbi:hypothetical protein ABZX95_48625 [Streptomyces sp. NPDC004232]|uniref:hypothetical protein n=1 Tax=Streptomyces sp. NPDC004232 TaxID=3154454 RepID=UPI0033B7515D
MAPERARMAHMGGGLVSDNRHSPPHTVAYDTFQEPATRIYHRSPARSSDGLVCD